MFSHLNTSRWNPTEIMTDVDYTDDLVFLTNTPAQATSLLYSLEQAARCIALYVNANKTVHVFLNKKPFSLFKWQAYEISRPVHIP